MLELRKLFALLVGSRRKYVDPSRFVFLVLIMKNYKKSLQNFMISLCFSLLALVRET